MFHVRRLIAQSNLSTLKSVPKYSNIFYSTQSPKITQKAASTTNFDPESLNLSDSCVKRLKDLSQKGQNQYLRVIVESGGCSGLNYKFSLDSSITNEDIVIEKEGAKVLVDKETVSYIKGSVLDYYEELIRAGFRIINNPNSEQGCSCGSSFSIKI